MGAGINEAKMKGNQMRTESAGTNLLLACLLALLSLVVCFRTSLAAEELGLDNERSELGVMYRFLYTGSQDWNVEWWNGGSFHVSVDSIQVHTICLVFSFNF